MLPYVRFLSCAHSAAFRQILFRVDAVGGVHALCAVRQGRGRGTDFVRYHRLRSVTVYAFAYARRRDRFRRRAVRRVFKRSQTAQLRRVYARTCRRFLSVRRRQLFGQRNVAVLAFRTDRRDAVRRDTDKTLKHAERYLRFRRTAAVARVVAERRTKRRRFSAV